MSRMSTRKVERGQNVSGLLATSGMLGVSVQRTAPASTPQVPLQEPDLLDLALGRRASRTTPSRSL